MFYGLKPTRAWHKLDVYAPKNNIMTIHLSFSHICVLLYLFVFNKLNCEPSSNSISLERKPSVHCRFSVQSHCYRCSIKKLSVACWSKNLL